MCDSMEKLREYVINCVVIIPLLSPLVIGLGLPTFKGPIENITVAVGREAILACAVENLSPYKGWDSRFAFYFCEEECGAVPLFNPEVHDAQNWIRQVDDIKTEFMWFDRQVLVAWLKVDTQTILTIHHHVITKNSRIGMLHTENNIWHLHIKEVRESDQGWYMCQINTDPMKSQKGHLTVVVPPDILDYPTSTDMVVDEGTNVTLQCFAKGSPEPKVIWKREDGGKIELQNISQDFTVTGPVLKIVNVMRQHMGAYLCIASNGVPPSVSKRIKLIVQFAPTIWIKYQLIGAYDGQTVTLECHSQAYPKAINYWTKDTGDIIPNGIKYIPEIIENGYKVYMRLTINYLEMTDYGVYKCVSKNAVADMEGSINIYRIPDPNKLLVGKRKIAHHNSSIVGSPHISDDVIIKSNLNNITYKRITAERDYLNYQGYYYSSQDNSPSSVVLYKIFIFLFYIPPLFAMQ